jgi:beta-lactam-binding protein with PASTA domain
VTAQSDKSRVKVPSVLTKARGPATELLAASNLKAVFVGELTGLATAQSPAAETWVTSGSRVTVTLANPPAIVPSLDGLTRDQAQLRLRNASLTEGAVAGDKFPGSTVVAQSIVAGSEEPRGTAVGFTLRAPAIAQPAPAPLIPLGVPAASGPNPAAVVDQPQQIKVPLLQNKTLAEARATLAGVRLAQGAVSGSPDGLVDTQSPLPEGLVPAGTAVGFHLKLETVPVPNVVQDAPSAAAKRFAVFKLKPRFEYASDVNRTRALVVVSQTPEAGTDVEIGSSVTVVLGNAPLPVWVWPITALGSVLGLVGLGKLIRRSPTHSFKPADWTLSPRQAVPQIRLGQNSPKLQFCFGLQHHAPPALYRIEREPTLMRRR